MNQYKYLGFSTLKGISLIENLKFAKDNSFNAISIDLSWNQKVSFSDKEIKSLQDFSNAGNKIVIHMPFYLPTNSCISEIVEGVKKFFRKVVRFSSLIGASSITFHAGYVEQFLEDKTNKYIIKNLEEVIEDAKQYNLDISLENDNKNSEYPAWSFDDCKEILEGVEGLKFTFDVGHAATAKFDILSVFNKIKDKIDVVHIHNNNGVNDEHNSLDEGIIDYAVILQKLINMKDDAIFIFELFPFEKILKNRDIFLKFIC